MVKLKEKFQTSNPGEEWIEERLFVREILNHPDLPDVSLAVCRVPIGVSTQLHSLSVDETYLIKSGIGEMEKGLGEPYKVEAGDCIHIPAGVAQKITNMSDSDLIFEVICTPRFKTSCYTSLE